MSKLELQSYTIENNRIIASLCCLSIEDENELDFKVPLKEFLQWLETKAHIDTFKDDQVAIEYLSQTSDYEGEYQEVNFTEWLNIEHFLSVDNNESLLEEFLNEKVK